MSETAILKPAASVILLRPAHPGGFEVLLTRRPESMAFLGGMYCFPGGAMHREDHTEAMLRRARGLTPDQARKILGAYLAPEMALGLWLAAVRELFEEAGVLLASDAAGQPLSAKKARFAEIHAALEAKSLSFQALLEKEDWRCDIFRLGYFSHWQTPPDVPIRFDTRFFVAALPEGQTSLETSGEVAHSLWLTPDDALRLFGKAELPMIFATFASLRTLADFDSLESVLKEYHARPSL